ncbi:fungal-specific transcription factor domain-containing protein [Kalaharituber pfeilii]|nr:fungal-specific transcription factor domain-containing protein [Kalaharituber pfeilii]
MTMPNSPLGSAEASNVSATSASVSQKRRRRRSASPPAPGATAEKPSPEQPSINLPPSSTTGASSFRNVSACNRCRLRKNRCDQRLPACMSCEKAGVKCVGYDPITKREIPRSYVYYLETRNAYLESLLVKNQIPFQPPDNFDLPVPAAANTVNITSPPGNAPKSPITPATTIEEASPTVQKRQRPLEEGGDPDESLDSQGRLNKLVSDIGLISVQGASDPRYLGSVSGISFARVVFAAVKSSTANSGSSNNGHGSISNEYSDPPKEIHRNVSTGKTGKEDTAMRDSFFGLATNKRRVRPAKWPSRQLADRLVGLYFGHANPQLPILHKGEFEAMVEQVYATMKTERTRQERGDTEGAPRRKVGARELYMMNIVFAIGAGIFLEKDSGNSSSSGNSDDDARQRKKTNPRNKPKASGGGAETGKGGPRAEDPTASPRVAKKAKITNNGDGGELKRECSSIRDESENEDDGNMSSMMDEEGEGRQYAPEAYHAAALPHLETFLSSESKGGLEELQAVLLLAGYALLRPVAPGLWYIVGVAVRLAVDLGLHFEDSNAGTTEGALASQTDKEFDKLRGRREWVRDLRRKLWWCTYSLDRLVSTCVGRPFGIQDEVVSTRFPSLLPDEYITPNGFLIPSEPSLEGSIAPVLPTYKLIAHHYFKLRLLQSEILQVLQQQQTMSTLPPQEPYPSYHPFHLRTPYLRDFPSLQEWHKDVTRRVKEWIDTAPKTKAETGVDFAFEFFQLNYWQTVLMLYRPCLKVPALLSGELGGGRGMVDSGGKGVGIGQLRGGNDSDGGVYMGGLTSGSQDEEDRIYCLVADAGSEVLKLYRRLHRVHQVNYTFLATHHLFMAGIAFLYAIWHSPVIRSRLSMDDIDFTILAATSVLGDLVEKCPPAQACKEAFERMSKATVSMCLAGNNVSAGGISIPRSLGSIVVGPDLRFNRDLKRRSGGRNGHYSGGSSAHHVHRNRVLKDSSRGYPVSGNSMTIQQHQMRQEPLMQQQQSYPHQDQHWQRQLQNQQQQQQQKQLQRARCTNSTRNAATIDIGFENLFQTGQGVQMSGSNYRSTQQHGKSRESHGSMVYTPSMETEEQFENDGISDNGQVSTTSPLLPPALNPRLILETHQKQQRLQKSYQQQREGAEISSETLNAASALTSSSGDDAMIDPELQRDELEGAAIKLSPSVVSDTSGGYSNQNAAAFDMSLDSLDWDAGGWGEYDAAGGAGMGMGMGMGMGQVDLFDGFFFGSGGMGN